MIGRVLSRRQLAVVSRQCILGNEDVNIDC